MLAFVLVAVVVVGVQLPVPAPTNLKVEHRAASPEDDRYYAPPGIIFIFYIESPKMAFSYIYMTT